jgi:polar amino acid transport system substrate-binding protein
LRHARIQRRRAFLARAGVLLALLFAAGAALGGEPVRMAADPWPPYTDRALPHQGLAVGIVGEALTRAGHPTTLTITEWEKVMEGAADGGFDVMVGAWETEERAKTFAFSEPYLFNEIKLVKLRDAPFSFADILARTRPELTMGLVRNYGYGEALAPLRSYANRNETDVSQLLLRLVQGEIDFAVCDDRSARHHLKEILTAHAERVEISPEPLSRTGLRMAIALDHPRRQELMADFSRSLASMREDGTLAKLFAEFGIEGPEATGGASAPETPSAP